MSIGRSDLLFLKLFEPTEKLTRDDLKKLEFNYTNAVESIYSQAETVLERI